MSTYECGKGGERRGEVLHTLERERERGNALS